MSSPTDSRKTPPNVTAAAKSAAEVRQARLAAQLRANLKKRKALARSRAEDESDGAGGGGPAGAQP